MSKQSLVHVDDPNAHRNVNASDKIFSLIRELTGSSKTVKISDVIERCIDKGFKPDQVSFTKSK